MEFLRLLEILSPKIPSHRVGCELKKIIDFLGRPWHFLDFWILDPLKSPFGPPGVGWGFKKKKNWFSGQFMTFPGLFNFWPPKIPPGTPLGSGGSNLFRFESVPYPSEYVCQIWLRSDRRECNAGMTIAKCTKTAASSNVSNRLSRTPAAWCASGAAHHARPYRNLGRRISLRSYTIVVNMSSLDDIVEIHHRRSQSHDILDF